MEAVLVLLGLGFIWWHGHAGVELALTAGAPALPRDKGRARGG